MQYFRPYSLPIEDGVVAAWDSQLASAADIPNLRRLIAERGAEIFPEFARRYAEIRALPRSARRALHRRLAASRELAGIPGEWRRKLAYSVAGAALLLALSQSPAQAGTMTVNTINPAIVSDGKCSLIEAIVNANDGGATHADCSGATGGPNTIVLPKGTHTLIASDDGFNGLPFIQTDITIEGNGAKIVRSAAAPQFRLLSVLGTGTLRLKNTTLSGGNMQVRCGGAIFVYNGSLHLENATITGNTAKFSGGAICNYRGNVSISTSTLSRNSTPGDGGALYGFYAYSHIEDSLITGNHADGMGGGIYHRSGTVSLYRSTISRNTAGLHGGGVAGKYGETYIEDHTTITGNTAAFNGGGVVQYYGYVGITGHSTISKNSAKSGGGVYSRDSQTYIADSTITGNTASYLGGGGGVRASANSFHMNRSTISKNSTPGPGGGVRVDYTDDAYIKDSTITGNKAVASGGGVVVHSSTIYLNNDMITKNSTSARGGGIYMDFKTLTLFNSTITGNKAKLRGGGLDIKYINQVEVTNNTVTGNSAPVGPNYYPGPVGP